MVRLNRVDGVSKLFPAGDIVTARDFLVTGNCHSLALAVHHITGFAFACFRSIKPEVDALGAGLYEPHIRHIAVVDPNGWVIDGHGVRGLDEVTNNYNWSVQLVGSANEMMDLITQDANEYGRSWLPPDPEKLASFAYALAFIYYLD
jgi:hypothetical protein